MIITSGTALLAGVVSGLTTAAQAAQAFDAWVAAILGIAAGLLAMVVTALGVAAALDKLLK